MKTAEEIIKARKERGKARDEQIQAETVAKVDAYTEKLFSGTKTKTFFTEEEMEAEFGIGVQYAINILQANGFVVRYFPEETLGHLWWKKVTAAKYVISTK